METIELLVLILSVTVIVLAALLGIAKTKLDITKLTYENKIERAIDSIKSYGMIDGEHHKQWLLSNTLKLLMGSNGYHTWKDLYDYDDDYDNWDEGIAP